MSKAWPNLSPSFLCIRLSSSRPDEDRSRIRTGYGPENISRLRRFAIGIINSKGVRSVAQKMRQLTLNIRLVFDYLRMTKNSCLPLRL